MDAAHRLTSEKRAVSGFYKSMQSLQALPTRKECERINNILEDFYPYLYPEGRVCFYCMYPLR